MSYDDRCLTCNTTCTPKELCDCCQDKRNRTKYCICIQGPELDKKGKRSPWTKPRCVRCKRFVFVFDKETTGAI